MKLKTKVIVGASIGIALIVTVAVSISIRSYQQRLAHDLSSAGFIVQQEGLLERITKLHYMGTGEDLPLEDELVERLCEIGTLRGLFMFGARFDAHAIPSEATLPNLEELNLSETSVGDREIAAFSGCPLIELRLAKTHITNSVATTITEHAQLQRLQVSLTKVGDSFMAAIPRLRHLQTLDLTETAVTGEGVTHLSSATSLKKLWLSNTLVDDRIWPALQSLPELEFVELLNTYISPIGTAEFARQHPDVELRVDRDIAAYLVNQGLAR